MLRKSLLIAVFSGSSFSSSFLFSQAIAQDKQGDHHANHTTKEASSKPPHQLQSFDPTQAEFAKLKEATKSEIVNLTADQIYELKATIVKQTIGGREFRRFAYNGSIPGPLFKIKQGMTAKIRFVNETDVETSIHSHGLRLSWKMDGQVPTSQAAVKPGESFTYELKFPDAGIYWYHPHIREDYQQDMGLMGNFWVEPAAKAHWNQVSKEEVLMLDDMLAKEPVPYPLETANHAIMGRFGDTMLVNGKEKQKNTYQPGEVVRYFVTNAANTRTFRMKFNGAKMKLVGSDLSQIESETHVDAVTISPGERAIIEVLFPKDGSVRLENATPADTTLLSEYSPSGAPANGSYLKNFERLRLNAEITKELKAAVAKADKEKKYSLTLDVNMSSMKGMDHSTMDHSKMDHQMPKAKNSERMRDAPWAPAAEKIEWEDHMAALNASSDTNTVKWKMVDQDNKENMNANWILKKGSSVRVTLINPQSGQHPMQHPIHFHGQRFFVDKINGTSVKSRAWKDTILVGQGDTVEIVIEASNPGKWMAHCHIAEHLTSGMMTGFEVIE